MLALAAVLLRCWSRFAIGKKLEIDDWTIIMAACVICGLIAVDTKSSFTASPSPFDYSNDM